MKKNLTIIILVLILFLGSALRLWELGNTPVSPDWDEASLAYNAYSLLETGKDEYGESYPPVLRSFDDYKPAVYAYLAIPAIKLFGLSTFAVRLPSAVFGIVAILAFYYLIKELFATTVATRKYGEVAALVSAFLLAISPWHLQFSRAAFESNIGLTINILVALFFIKGLKKPWLMLLSAFFAGLNFSVYQSERVFTPLLLIALASIYYKEFLKLPKKILVGALFISILTILPLGAYIYGHPHALDRVQSTSMFNQTDILKGNILRYSDDKENNDYLGQLFDNRRMIFVKEIAAGYIAHFDLNWLFITGDMDNNRHHAPRMGLLYLFTLPFLLIGIYKLLFGKFNKRVKYVIFCWFLIAPIPASITLDVPHAVRTLNMLPAYILFTTIGLLAVYTRLTQYKKILILFLLGLGFAGVINFSYFLNQYYVQQNYFHAYDWQYGYEETVKELEATKGKYKKIIVSNVQPMDQSYIFFLFYLKYPPSSFQGAMHSQGAREYRSFDKYEFRDFDWSTEKNKKDTLIVGVLSDFPNSVATQKRMLYPNNKPAILIVDPEKNL